METKNKPKHIKFGSVRATIWQDQRKGPNGTFITRNVTIDRAYKDAQGNWQNTASFHENDLPKAIVALQKAFEFLTRRESEQTGDNPDDDVPIESVD